MLSIKECKRFCPGPLNSLLETVTSFCLKQVKSGKNEQLYINYGQLWKIRPLAIRMTSGCFRVTRLTYIFVKWKLTFSIYTRVSS